MKPSKWYESMMRKIQFIENDLGPLILAATSTVSEAGARIFEQGKDSTGKKIGKYRSQGDGSPKEGGFWTNIDTLPKKPKKFRKKTKDGKRVYYPAYITLREEMGRQTKFVDLKFTGNLAMNFLGSSVSSTGGDITGLNVQVKKISRASVGVVLRNENVEKVDDNEERFNKEIFKLTEKEKRIFQKVFKAEVLKRLGAA